MASTKPFRSKILGILLLLVATAGYAVFKWSATGRIPDGGGIVQIISGAVVLGATTLAWKLLSTDADKILRNPRRKIVLYLRPFEVDAALPRWNWPGETNYEQELGYSVASIGKLVAVGKPKEKLATFGAPRAYIPHTEWKESVKQYIQRAELVVIHPDASESVEWEITTTLDLKDRRHVLFFFPTGNTPLPALLGSNSPVLQQLAQCNLGKAKFAWFNDAGEIEALRAEGPSRWALTQKYLNKWSDAPIFAEALQPLLARYGVKPGFIIRFISWTPYIYLAMAIILVIACLLISHRAVSP